jgi:hypothetical protein
MNCCVDKKSIVALEFNEGVFVDTLKIAFRNGTTKTIRKALDAECELKAYYYELLKETGYEND